MILTVAWTSWLAITVPTGFWMVLREVGVSSGAEFAATTSPVRAALDGRVLVVVLCRLPRRLELLRQTLAFSAAILRL